MRALAVETAVDRVILQLLDRKQHLYTFGPFRPVFLKGLACLFPQLSKPCQFLFHFAKNVLVLAHIIF